MGLGETERDENGDPVFNDASDTIPQIEFLFRYGVSENWDIGFKVYNYLLGYEINTKYQFLGNKSGSGFSMSAIGEVSSSVAKIFSLTTGVALSYDFSDVFGFYSGARYSAIRSLGNKYGQDNSISNYDFYGHAALGTFGLNFNFDGLIIRPEVTYTHFFKFPSGLDHRISYMITPSVAVGVNF